MLEDRDYMREPDYRGRGMSMTTLLTIVLVVVFALQCIDAVYLHTGVERWLALTPEGVRHGWVWQLVTFQFLHYNLMHIAFNLIAFWWIGHFVEGVLGRKRFLVAMFGSGIVGGILQGILMILVPQYFGFPMVGASAGVAGLLAIFALLERDSEIRYNFVLPIKAIWFLYIFGAISLFFTLVPADLGIAHAAHLGGLLAGVAWVKLGWHRDFVELPWEAAIRKIRNLGSNRNSNRRHIQSRADFEGGSSGDATPGTDFLKDEVDAILDKISAHGIQSLTANERSILESARKKMSRK